MFRRRMCGRGVIVGALLALTMLASVPAAVAKGEYEPGPAERVGLRTSRDGVAIRVYVAGMPDSWIVPVGAGVPGDCNPDSQLSVQVSTRLVAAVATAGVRRDARIGPLVGQVVGIAEGAPIGIVVVQPPEGVDAVVARFDVGAVDRSEVGSNPWVVLASRLGDDAPVPAELPPVEAGRVPLLTEVPEQERLARLTYIEDGARRAGPAVDAYSYDFASPLDCASKPPLPEAAGAPPADPDTARRDIKSAFRQVFESGDREARLAAIEEGDAPEVIAASEQATKDYGEDVQGVEIHFDGLRFMNEERAAVRFDLLLDGERITATTLGFADFVDGRWKVARSTYCGVLGRGNIIC